MPRPLQALLTVLARVMLAMIFLMSAVGNKIPNFNSVVEYMRSEGVPAPPIALGGAILFLVVGSLSLLLGFKARIGALLLLIFLILATYYFHDFWTFEDEGEKQLQMIQFMKNVALMGAMVFIVANGPGPLSLSRSRRIQSDTG